MSSPASSPPLVQLCKCFFFSLSILFDSISLVWFGGFFLVSLFLIHSFIHSHVDAVVLLLNCRNWLMVARAIFPYSFYTFRFIYLYIRTVCVHESTKNEKWMSSWDKKIEEKKILEMKLEVAGGGAAWRSIFAFRFLIVYVLCVYGFFYVVTILFTSSLRSLRLFSFLLLLLFLVRLSFVPIFWVCSNNYVACYESWDYTTWKSERMKETAIERMEDDSFADSIMKID